MVRHCTALLVARKKAQEKAEHDARVAEKEAALAHALQHAQEMKAAAAEKAAVDKINARETPVLRRRRGAAGTCYPHALDAAFCVIVELR